MHVFDWISFNIFSYEYPPFPETGGSHFGEYGVWCLIAFGCVSIVLIYYFETRCCKGEGLKVRVRSFIPSVSWLAELSILTLLPYLLAGFCVPCMMQKTGPSSALT